MLRVTLVQARRTLFEGGARQVILPGESGELSVLDCHAPLVCALGAGALQIDDASFAIRGGIARVARNAVTILAR